MGEKLRYAGKEQWSVIITNGKYQYKRKYIEYNKIKNNAIQ